MTTVRDNLEKNRYEIYDSDQLAGFSDYTLTHGKIAFIHTEVGAALKGKASVAS